MSAWGNSPELEAQARGTVSMMDELLHDQPKAIATEVPYAARAFTTRDIYCRSSVNCLLGIEHLDPGGREGRPLTAHGSLSDA